MHMPVAPKSMSDRRPQKRSIPTTATKEARKKKDPAQAAINMACQRM